MATPIIPLINGETYAWASIRAVVLGKSVTSISSVEYGVKQEMDNVYGAGEFPIALGLGNKSSEGKITMLLEEVKDLIALSPSQFGHLQDIPFFDIVVTFQPKEGGAVLTNILTNCKFKETNISVSQNDKSVPIELPLYISNVNFKG